MKDFLSHLNKEQYEAATTIDGPMLIIAGAGSGKTMTLVSRIANMIDEGIDPESILLLTFTNKAAKEMKSRIIVSIGEPAAKVTATTFHSFCAMFLRKYAHAISIDHNFTVMDGPDAAEAISIVMSEFLEEQKEKGIVYDGRSFPTKKELAAWFSYSVNNCEDLLDVVFDRQKEKYFSEISEIYDRYVLYKKEHMLMDYDDLLCHTKEILTNHNEIRNTLNEKYRYVCCDEYQDTNLLQDDILDLMCRVHNNLSVVGDENQSIYKFRGAKIENILTFRERHPGCKMIILNQNYRSSQEILDLSNAVMEYATEGTKKTLVGQFNGVTPDLIVVNNDNEQNHTIINKIKVYQKRGIPLNRMAVIVRSSVQSYGLETVLNSEGIPYNKYGGLKFMEKTVVKDVLSFLRVTVNNKDEIALFRILQLYPGIGKKYSNKITNAVLKGGLIALKTIYKANAFHVYLEELYDFIVLLSEKNVNEQLEYILEEYYTETVKRNIRLSKTSESKKMESLRLLHDGVEDAKMLLSMAEKYTATRKFLEDVVLENTIRSDDENKLNITTIHSAKGLEYDVVFLMDVVEGITPKCDQMDDEDAEELRCFYVALTRARKYLHLFVPRKRLSPPYQNFDCKLSHFINYDDVLMCLNISSDISRLRESYDAFRFW